MEERSRGRARRPPTLAAAVGLLLIVAACGAGASPTARPAPSATPAATANSSPTAMPLPTATPGPSPTPSPTPSPRTGVPAFRHVYVIVMENQEYDAIVGKAAAPYLNGLIDRYGLATAYFAVTHPSQPNYLALFSGSTQGVTDNGRHDLDAPNLADRIEAAGRSWRVYAENVRPGCFTGGSASGGADGPGTYARKHEPAISFTSISGSPERCARITDFSHLDPLAADFALIVPNMCHSMHDCSVATGDAFLGEFVPRIIGTPGWGPDDVLFITWDEGETNAGGGGHVATIVVSEAVEPGFRSAVRHTHYSLLRTIEDAWDLGYLGESRAANDLAEFFGNGQD